METPHPLTGLVVAEYKSYQHLRHSESLVRDNEAFGDAATKLRIMFGEMVKPFEFPSVSPRHSERHAFGVPLTLNPTRLAGLCPGRSAPACG